MHNNEIGDNDSHLYFWFRSFKPKDLYESFEVCMSYPVFYDKLPQNWIAKNNRNLYSFTISKDQDLGAA